MISLKKLMKLQTQREAANERRKCGLRRTLPSKARIHKLLFLLFSGDLQTSNNFGVLTRQTCGHPPEYLFHPFRLDLYSFTHNYSRYILKLIQLQLKYCLKDCSVLLFQGGGH